NPPFCRGPVMTPPSADQLTYFGSLVASAVIGLTMTPHCFGMCGALAAVIGVTGRGKPHWRILAYNTGRVTTYSLLGVIAGAIGQRFEISFGGTWLPAAVAGVSCAIIVFSALALMGLVPDRCLGAAFPSGFLARLMARKTPLIPAPAKVFVLGLLFGFLPCAATFGMSGVALGSGTWHRGGLIMLAFGLGTFPVMMGVPYAAQLAKRVGKIGYGRVAGALLLLLSAASMWNLWSMLTQHGCCTSP
ncbi:MAG: sulfite exporter TauE/SafE family protein, partial [Planctomycetota bacterium]